MIIERCDPRRRPRLLICDVYGMMERPLQQNAQVYRWIGVGGLLLFPSAALLVGLFLFPLLSVLSRSFTDPELGWQNYLALWQSRAFRNIIINTFQIAGWTTVICLCIGYPVAFHLTRLSPRWQRVCVSICMLPFFTSVLARLYAWTIILGDAGILNSFLQKWGVIEHPFNLLFNRSGVIVGMVHTLLPFTIIVLYSSMLGIDRSVLDAARSLGAGVPSVFRRVFLPLSMPGSYAAILLVFIIALGYFLTPAILGGARDITIAIFVRQKIGVLDWGEASAMSLILLLITVVLFFFFDRIFGTERLLVGGARR